MWLIRVSGVHRKMCQISGSVARHNIEKLLETEDAIERLGTVTEELVATPPNSALTKLQGFAQTMRDCRCAVRSESHNSKDVHRSRIRRLDARESTR
jgi:hypothetical protein